jgi:CheY-like chemotaxis protein
VWNKRVDQTVNATADVLVVDDDPIMRELVADWLEAVGYRVRKAPDCRAAITEMNGRAPTLVVTDMRMPGPCGGEAIARLKREFPGILLIAISGHFNSGCGFSAEDALAAGAARALAKPVKRKDILRAVAELSGRPVS